MSDQERWRRDHRVGPPDPGEDLDREIGFHLEELVAELMASGRSPEEARAEALRRFGSLRRTREATRAVDRRVARRRTVLVWLADWLGDFRVAGRVLARSPGFTSVAAASIALGVGATAAILSSAYAILVRPLPFHQPDRLISVYAKVEKRSLRGINISYPDYLDWKERNTTLSGLGIWTWWSIALTDGTGGAERIDGAAIAPELFGILGVSPVLGRSFTAEDAVRGAPPVIILGHTVWTQRYGGDSTLVGRAILVDGRPTVVVGVMPPRFAFPDGERAWIPFIPAPDEAHQNRGYAGAVGRVAPGVTIAAAAADLDRISVDLERQLPNENLDWRADVVSLRDDLIGSLRGPLQVFMVAVVCLLAIVSANVANLLLVRGIGRRRELAVRTAIGAGRRRLVRQLLIESLALSLLGGLGGVAVAAAGIRLLAWTFPQGVPFFLTLELDPSAVAITAGVTLVTALLAGLLPAFQSSGFDLASAFRDGGAGSSGGSAQSGRIRRGLVVAELALSIVLLIGGGLLIKSFARLAATDLGFDRRGLVTFRISLPSTSYPEPSRRQAFYQTLLERLGTVPGVLRAGSAQGTPMSGWDVQSGMMVEGNPPRDRSNPLDVHFQNVSPGYFDALGLPIVRGRGFTASDRDTLAPVGVINEVLAEEEFGTTDPVGRRITWDVAGDGKPRWITIVGVVKSFRHYRLPQRMGPALYLPYALYPAPQQDIVLRTAAADPLSLIPSVRAVVRELDPTIPIFRVATFDQTLARVLWQQRLQGQVAGIFAALAVALATLGIYGVISYNVSQRTRELGIRAAVGATRRDLTGLVIREAGRITAAGVVAGALGAFGAGRLLAASLPGVGSADAAIFLLAPGLLALVALAASWIPARRAARADPMVAIRD